MCKVGGVKLNMIIDSGSDANIIGWEEWSKMKEGGVQIIEQVKGSDRVFMGYANHKQLKVMGTFKAEIEVGGKKLLDLFYVIKEGQRSLLGRETAQKLGVLKMGLNVNEVTQSM